MTTFHATTPHFRGDIQGLRGIAVLLVVLFHAGVTTLSGGFIGVDIFFVISGYVISGLLIREIDSADVAKGSIGIDFPNFYARRLRRLLPAAIIVIVTTSVAAWFIYAPLELKIYITSAFAALVYISNLRYAESATNYFAESADADPFLHTWSLAVEEQFYILWPLLLFLVIRGAPKAAIRQRLILTMVLIGAGSLALSIYFTHHNQPWAFFNPLTRAWEFALGALAYIIGTRECVRTISWAPLLQWTGLLALAAAALTFNAHTRFPGFAALIPTIGTFAVLLTYVSPSRSILTRWLESAPMRLCGDISYSWYLWHWAIFVFGRELFGLGSPAVRALMLGLSLALAWVTYVLVENPVRQGRSKMLSQPKKTLLIGLITTMTIAIAILAARQVLKRELDTDRQRPFAVAREDIPQDKQGCHLGYLPTTQPECAYGDPSSSHVVVLFGDSHAAQWLPALEQSAKERHWKLYWWTKSGCPSGV